MSKTAAQKTVDALGLTVTSRFIPFSQSRNKAEKYKSLNWEVTVHLGDVAILSTLYSAGIAHAPSYKHSDKAETHHRVNWECENGYKAQGVRWGRTPEAYGAMVERNAIKPDTLDVLYSLAMDADALEYAGFEDWANSLGYDTDSRKAEKVFTECLGIALKLRHALGEEGLKALREAFQDY
jgi:hypothetical protein